MAENSSRRHLVRCRHKSPHSHPMPNNEEATEVGDTWSWTKNLRWWNLNIGCKRVVIWTFQFIQSRFILHLACILSNGCAAACTSYNAFGSVPLAQLSTLSKNFGEEDPFFLITVIYPAFLGTFWQS